MAALQGFPCEDINRQGERLKAPASIFSLTAVSKVGDALTSSSPSSFSAVDMSTGAYRKWDKSGPHFKQGKFSRAETETLVDAIETYARTHQIPVEALCSEGCLKTYRGAWITIADCLPERAVQAIYRHGRRKLHGLKRGAWTKEEESKLLALVEEHGNKWSVIEQLLGRPADTCRDKYRDHKTDPATGQWTEEEEKRLEQAVREKIQDPGNKLDAIEGEKTDMDWAEVAKRVGTRNRISCLKKWDDLEGKRLKQRLLSDAGSKLRLRLSIAREVLNTGARDETEVVWTKLACPRSQRYWMTLRRGLPSTMPLDAVARAIIQGLEQEMSQVGSDDSVAVEHKDIPASSIESSTPSPSPSGWRKCDADQSSTGQGSESGLRRGLGAQGEGASDDDQASSSPQRSNGSETRLESSLQDDARREALHLERPSNIAKQGRDVSDGSSAEVCGETLEVGRRSRKEKRKNDEDSRDGDNRHKREKGGSANRHRKKEEMKTGQTTDQRSPLQVRPGPPHVLRSSTLHSSTCTARRSKKMKTGQATDPRSPLQCGEGGEAMLWETLSGTEGLASPPSLHWTALDAGFSAIFGLGPGAAQWPAGGVSPSEATVPRPRKGPEPLDDTRPPESLQLLGSRSPSEVEEGRRMSKFERMLCSVLEDND